MKFKTINPATEEIIKEKYVNIPRQEIKDFRNVVIHIYHSIDAETLWDIIKNKLDTLRQ